MFSVTIGVTSTLVSSRSSSLIRVASHVNAGVVYMWHISHAQHDQPKWIDTSTMISDSLTKARNANFADWLAGTLATGFQDLRATR